VLYAAIVDTVQAVIDNGGRYDEFVCSDNRAAACA